MKTVKSSTTIAIAALALTAAAVAAPGEWSFTAKIGTVNSTGGDVHRGPSFDGSVLLDLAPGSLPVEVDAKSFDDVYGDFTEIALEFGYHASETTTYYFGLSQMKSDDGMLQVGEVNGALPLMGRFSGYDDIGIFGGIRYHFETEGKWKPHVSGQLAYKQVDEIRASFSVPDVTFVAPYQDALTRAAFYDDSDVWSFGVFAGLDYVASEGVTIGLETGFVSQGALDDDDSVLDVLGLGALNDEGDIEYMPLRLTASFSF